MLASWSPKMGGEPVWGLSTKESTSCARPRRRSRQSSVASGARDALDALQRLGGARGVKSLVYSVRPRDKKHGRPRLHVRRRAGRCRRVERPAAGAVGAAVTSGAVTSSCGSTSPVAADGHERPQRALRRVEVRSPPPRAPGRSRRSPGFEAQRSNASTRAMASSYFRPASDVFVASRGAALRPQAVQQVPPQRAPNDGAALRRLDAVGVELRRGPRYRVERARAHPRALLGARDVLLAAELDAVLGFLVADAAELFFRVVELLRACWCGCDRCDCGGGVFERWPARVRHGGGAAKGSIHASVSSSMRHVCLSNLCLRRLAYACERSKSLSESRLCTRPVWAPWTRWPTQVCGLCVSYGVATWPVDSW